MNDTFESHRVLRILCGRINFPKLKFSDRFSGGHAGRKKISIVRTKDDIGSQTQISGGPVILCVASQWKAFFSWSRVR